MKVGSEFRIGVLVTIGLMALLAGPVGAQSVSVDLDRNASGIQTTLNADAGSTIQGSIVLDGLTAYRGHTLRVQLVDSFAIEGSIVYTAGDIAGSNNNTVTAVGVTFMSSVLLQAIPVDWTTFPATAFNFDLTLASTATGDVPLHIIYVGDTSVPSNLTTNLAIVTPGGSLVLNTENFTLNDGTITIGGAVPTDTPTPTPTGPTPTPEEPTPTPTPTEPIPETGYIVLDGFGGMHPIGIAPSVTGNSFYYPGIDMVVDAEILPDNSGIVVIDNMGGNFVFGLGGSTPSVAVDEYYIPETVLPPTIYEATPSYVAVEAAADSAGYWVLDDMGQIYGVGTALPEGATQSLLPGVAVDPPLPAYDPNESNYYRPDGSPIPEGENPGWFSAVDFIVVENGMGVIIADRWGDQHIIGDTSDIHISEDTIHPYFGWDIVRAIELEPQGRGYMLLDGFGAVHPVPSLPLNDYVNNPVREAYDLYIGSQPYFGWDVAESLAYAPDGMGWVTLDAFGGTHYVGQITDVRVLYFGWDIARDIEIYAPEPLPE